MIKSFDLCIAKTTSIQYFGGIHAGFKYLYKLNNFQIYNGINDKVVGLLLRARKKHLLTFEGEMLFQV